MKKALLLFVIIATVTLTYLYPHKMINPGELSQGHQNLAHKCVSCHQPFSGISNDKCISCHKLADIGKDTYKVLFHKNFNNQDCIACHTDHKGIDPKLSLGKFEHSLITKPLLNNCVNCHKSPDNELHKQLTSDCKSCHNTSDWKSVKTFNHELITGLNKTNCISCHQYPEDVFHQSVKINCNECHTTNKWLPSSFKHSSFFVLDKDHSPNKCSNCHVNNDYKKYTCYGCHEHSETKIRSEHLEEGIRNFQDCVLCHKSANEHDIRMPNNSGQTIYKKSNREEEIDND